jgi:NAD-dependent deacetylase
VFEPIVVLTGAGISAESGIPTFRGPEGIWNQRRAEELASPQAFSEDPGLIWEFYAWRRKVVAAAEPNRAHRTLVEIEAACSGFLLITQNVDGLHKRAGNKRILELHGSLWRFRCTCCQHEWDDFNIPLQETIPSCPECRAMARPGVVWFGEAIPARLISAAVSAAEGSRLMLVIGTSALVQPAASLPFLAKRAGARIVEINPEKTPVSLIADEQLNGRAAEVLPEWWSGVQA